MSVVDHFLAKNFGQYVLVLERELEKDGVTAIQQASIHANIARAQFGKRSIAEQCAYSTDH